jgi:hypothetical protein
MWCDDSADPQRIFACRLGRPMADSQRARPRFSRRRWWHYGSVSAPTASRAHFHLFLNRPRDLTAVHNRQWRIKRTWRSPRQMLHHQHRLFRSCQATWLKRKPCEFRAGMTGELRAHRLAGLRAHRLAGWIGIPNPTARGQTEAYPLSFRSQRGRRNLLHHAASCILRTLGQNRTFSFLVKKDGARF